MGRSFKDSLKALEADIQLANTIALGHRRELDGACIQMRLAYSPASQFCLFLLQWFDCKVAGALGLLEVLVYMAYADGKTSMYIKERRASIREFYEIIFPSLQIQRGITDFEEMKQKEICSLRYSTKGKLSEIELEREAECGICLEPNSKVVMPDCRHSLCLRCFQEWRSRSQSCPFCRSNLRRVNSDDLWVCVEKSDTVELPLILREDWKRLYSVLPLMKGLLQFQFCGLTRSICCICSSPIAGPSSHFIHLKHSTPKSVSNRHKYHAMMC